MRKRLRVRTPAKINLYLRVVGKRPDGYHELETLFQAIDLMDELVLTKASGDTRLVSPGYPELETEQNLVLKALNWVEKAVDSPLHVHIHLTKRIPLGGGLGGGSSDAAATLIGLCELYDLPLDDSMLHRAALELGADVPFFLLGGTAIGQGIGEILTAVDISTEYALVLINPGFPVSTARVFREFSTSLTDNPGRGTLWGLLNAGKSLESFLHNDLQETTERLYSEVREIREFLEHFDVRGVLMSGSGPTVFAIVEPDNKITDQMKKTVPTGWTMLEINPLTHGPEID